MKTQRYISALMMLRWIDAFPFLLFGWFAWMIMQSPMQVNHDCAYVLHCSQLLTMGGLPYVDFIDVNPPLIFYLNTIPVYASNITGLTLPQAFSFFVLVQLVISTLIVRYLFNLPELNLKPAARAGLMLGWIMCSVVVYTTGDFGQRDYLVILTAFPFLLVRIIRYYGDTVRTFPSLLIGLLTGIGLCLKPNFLLIVAVPELIGLLRTKRFRVLLSPETAACGAFCAAYALHFFFLPPIVRVELFGRWIPFFTRYYGSINLNLFQQVIMQPVVITGIVVLCGFLLLAFIIVRRRGITSLRIEMLSGLVIGSFLSYWIQQKGYSYHALPAKISFVMLALFLSLWFYEEIMHRKEHFPFRRSIASASFLVILAGLIAVAARSFTSDGAYVAYRAFEPYRQAIRSHSAAHDRILFLNTILFPAYPTLVQTNRLPGSRYLTSFPVAAFYYGTPASLSGTFPYRRREAMPPEEKRFLAELASDIATNTPAMIFIHCGPHTSAMPEGFDLNEYFRRANFIAGAMAQYVPWGEVGEFFVYVRRANPIAAAGHTGVKEATL